MSPRLLRDRTVRWLPLALLLAVACLEAAHAVSLGRPRGLAVISRPLDMPFAARLDGAETLRADCVSADVFFGDRRLGSGDARVSVERSGDSADVVLRLRTRSLVDEPVVTVFLQAGCDLASTRRYVFFAEPPAAQEPASAATPSPTVAQPAIPLTPSVAAPTAVAAPKTSSVAAAASTKPARKEALPSPTGSAPAKDRIASPKRAPQARLKLEAIDLSTDAPLGLRSSAGLAGDLVAADAPESPELKQRRQAARELWAAVNSTPEERLQQNAKLDALDQRVAALGKQMAEVEQRAIQAAAATEAAKNERYRNPLVYALALLAAVLGALLAWLALKQREARRWWQPDNADQLYREASVHATAVTNGPTPMPQVGQGDFATASDGQQNTTNGAQQDATKGWRRKLWGRGDVAKPGAPSADRQPATRAKVAPASVLGDINDGLDVQSVSPSDFDRSLNTASGTPAGAGSVATTGLTAKGAPTASKPSAKVGIKGVEAFADELDIAAGGARRAVNVEELLDVHQQVEFFATLGQFDQAADLLQTQLDIAPDSSALLYLDLLDLYRKGNNQSAYEQTKQRLERRFAVKAPGWEEDSSHGRSLDEYQQAMDRITALWPSPKVLAVIEESLMHRPESSEQAFDLPAYRELLTLYAVASDIIRQNEGGASPTLLKARLKAAPADIGDLATIGQAAVDEVDVPLEFDDFVPSEQTTGFRNTTIEPLRASVSPVVDSTPPEHLGLDLDLSVLDVGEATAIAHNSPPAQADRVPGPDNNLIDFDPSGQDLPQATPKGAAARDKRLD